VWILYCFLRQVSRKRNLPYFVPLHGTNVTVSGWLLLGYGLTELVTRGSWLGSGHSLGCLFRSTQQDVLRLCMLLWPEIRARRKTSIYFIEQTCCPHTIWQTCPIWSTQLPASTGSSMLQPVISQAGKPEPERLFASYRFNEVVGGGERPTPVSLCEQTPALSERQSMTSMCLARTTGIRGEVQILHRMSRFFKLPGAGGAALRILAWDSLGTSPGCCIDSCSRIRQLVFLPFWWC
jgi:hypothetical protein